MCNILPKKNWHVLKKENIDRVRRDEAQAAEEEKARLRKIALAEKEARTELLRDKARANRRDVLEAGTSSTSLPISFTSSVEEAQPRTHINFFKESESGNVEEKANQERKKEEKEEQEKWERKVGISMALGQTPGGPLDSQLNPWWMQAKKKTDDEEDNEDEKDKKERKKGKYPEKKPVLSVKDRFDAEKIKEEGRHKRDERRKRQMDPMMDVEKQLSKHKKHKKDKHHYGDRERSSIRKEKKDKKDKKKNKTIEELRAERLKREGKERIKALDFLGGKPSKKEKQERQEKDRDADKSYFNSQFFPELARKKKQ